MNNGHLSQYLLIIAFSIENESLGKPFIIQSLITILFSKIYNCYWLPVDKNTCFTDFNHRFGYHPAHLHHFSRAIIAKDLYALMNEHYSRIIL